MPTSTETPGWRAGLITIDGTLITPGEIAISQFDGAPLPAILEGDQQGLVVRMTREHALLWVGFMALNHGVEFQVVGDKITVLNVYGSELSYRGYEGWYYLGDHVWAWKDGQDYLDMNESTVPINEPGIHDLYEDDPNCRCGMTFAERCEDNCDPGCGCPNFTMAHS